MKTTTTNTDKLTKFLMALSSRSLIKIITPTPSSSIKTIIVPIK